LTHCRVLLALRGFPDEDVLTPHMMGGGNNMKTCVIDVIKTARHTTEEGAHIPSWPKGQTIIIIII
jgi:hypothetical protein